jgi:pentatricopeptide repeat protein
MDSAMNDATNLQATPHYEATTIDEQSRLESALYDSDRLLNDSLREDDRRRRRRRLVSLTLLLGGIAMGSAMLAVLAGWFTLAAPPPIDGAEAKSSEAAPLDEEAKIERAEELSAKGWQLWQERKLNEAAKVFEQAAKLDPASANIWNGLGWARLNRGDSDAAIQAFEKCVELEPEHPAALNGLGQAYLAQGDFKKAEKFLTKAAPQAPAAYFGLSRLYLLTGEYKQAQQWIEKALAEQPDEPMLKAMLEASHAGKLPDDLRKQIEPVGKADRSPAVQASAEGWRLFNEGKFRTAERSFRKALAKDPENVAALNGLGFTLLTSGKAASAKTYFERCLKLEPDAAGPMNGLARCLKAEGKVDEAIEVWERMLKKYPGPNAAAVGLAATFLERKQYDKALPLFEELVKAQPNDEEFRKGLEAAKSGAPKLKEDAEKSTK